MPVTSENAGVVPRVPRVAGRLVSVTNSMRQGVRTHRTRTTGVPMKNPTSSARQAKRRAAVRSQVVSSRSSATSASPPPRYEEVGMDWCINAPTAPEPVSTVPSISLPAKLRRPIFREVSKEALLAADPAMGDVPPQYIRDKLVQTGSGALMLNVVSATTLTAAVGETLPSELSVLVADMSQSLPTHMLAVYAAKPTTPRQRVTLYPIHHLVLAAHCASLPPLCAPSEARETHITSDGLSATTTLPVIPLRLPHPESFPHLAAYLYTRRTDALLSALLPPTPQPTLDEVEPGATPRERLAHALAQTYTPRALLQRAMAVNGLWRNVCALGVSDARLWGAMDVMWEVLVGALSIGSGAAYPMTCTPYDCI